MTDEIYINNLQVEMSIGAYAWEHEARQTITVDICLYCESQAAGKSDKLEDAIDYSVIARNIKALAKTRHYTLVESFAESIANNLLANSSIHATRIKVTKPGAVPDADSISIAIVRP
ncbi:MAG: dihydroneopterin aldolase [Pseudomonadales bacterium]